MLAAVVLLAGCGVPDSGPVRTVPAEDVPFDLLSQKPTESSAERSEASGAGPSVYLVRATRLVPVGLDHRGGGIGTQLDDVLAALSDGPTSAEQDQGLGTAIPPGLTLAVARLEGNQVDVQLSGETAHPDVAQNALAAGQIVLTVTSVPGIAGVRLVRDGASVGPVLPDGTLANRAVTAGDYRPLLDSEPLSVPGSPTSSSVPAAATSVARPATARAVLPGAAPSGGAEPRN